MNKDRLLNVAKALRESPNPDLFNMDGFGHPCGAPACALGHYAYRRDLQDAFELNEDGYLDVVAYDHPSQKEATAGGPPGALFMHFGITPDQERILFDGSGCGDALTAVEAAEFIERFVKEAP